MFSQTRQGDPLFFRTKLVGIFDTYLESNMRAKFIKIQTAEEWNRPFPHIS